MPIYPLLIGSTTAPKDLAIAAVKAPESVFKGDIATIEVVVKADGVDGVDVPVTLERPGGAPIKQVVRGQAAGGRQTLSFRVPMENLGPQDLAVSVGPLAGDARPDNDRRSFTIMVADDKARVLLVDGEARWEFRYLYNALKRNLRVAVEAVVFRQPRFGASGYTYKNALPVPPRANDADPLGAYDAIVLGDVEPGLLAAEGWARLESFVARRGGTLILSAGPRAWPTESLKNEVVRKLLPVIDPKLAAFDTGSVDPDHPSLAPGVAVRPAALAVEAWPMLALAATAELSKTAWLGLPRLPWVLAGRAKPGATTLATIEASAPPGDGSVIAAQPYGLGKVLWVGTDATWRWRFRVGDAYHHRFWGQVVRWAAAGKLAVGADWVRFGPDRSRLPEGESAALDRAVCRGRRQCRPRPAGGGGGSSRPWLRRVSHRRPTATRLPSFPCRAFLVSRVRSRRPAGAADRPLRGPPGSAATGRFSKGCNRHGTGGHAGNHATPDIRARRSGRNTRSPRSPGERDRRSSFHCCRRRPVARPPAQPLGRQNPHQGDNPLGSTVGPGTLLSTFDM